MQEVSVKLGERSYTIFIGSGALDKAGELARQALGPKAKQVILITNPAVHHLCGNRAAQAFSRAGFRVHKALVGDGERFKTLRTVQSLYGSLIQDRIERSDAVVALGGGVTGDVAGFAAATYLRGVRLIQIPTTLLAQIDSSVGGKTGVNHALGKNLIGAFHQPAAVIVDPQTLTTLPQRQMRAGLQEALKYGIIRDRRLFDRIDRNVELLKGSDPVELVHLITRCCQIKAEVVQEDEREAGLRRILNFGHTIGHALEAASRYRRFLHGEAVGYGMRAASQIAQQMSLLSRDDQQAIDSAIARLGQLPRANSLAVDDIIAATHRDKKAEGGRLTFVLPIEVGRVVMRSDVPPRLVRSAIKAVLS